MNIGLRLRLSRRKRVGTGESKVVQSVRRLRRNHLEDSFNQNRDRPARLVGGKTFWRGQFKSIRSRPAARFCGQPPTFPDLKPKFEEKIRLPPQLFTGLHYEFWGSPLQPMNNCG